VSRAVLPGLDVQDPTLESAIRERLATVERELDDPTPLAESVGYLLAAGGKRFRPMVVLVNGYFGNPDDPRLITGSVAMELTHLASLYHDDVIDEADARRGIASANARWDNTVAILTGDFLFAKASELMADLGVEPTRILARTIATLTDGQIREVSFAGRTDQSVEFYLGTIRRKTSALIASSARLGGLLSGAPAEYLETLEAFGDEVGTAFQLSDDIMDLTASAEELGKEPGVDLKEGVYTLPVLDALGRGASGAELLSLLEAGPPEGDRLSRTLEIVRDNGSIDRAREVVASCVDRALELLERLPTSPATPALVQLSEFLAVRCGAR
jgi:heptaprenyl diphosphate synthase